MDIREIAIELAEGLETPFGINRDEYIDELQTGLEFIMKDEQLTLDQMRERCWENSDDVFNMIYGC